MKTTQHPLGALRRLCLGLLVATAAGTTAQTAFAQTRAVASQTGTALQLQVYARAMEGNLAGNATTRDVSVYLPPSYSRATWRRYPVLYMLHGSGGTHMTYFRSDSSLNIPAVADRTLANGTSREMIIVAPSGNSNLGGSNYSGGIQTGDFETFVARDLVDYIDKNFRTVARREGRGLAGHSMGGYGTWRIGMKNPDVYGALYVLSSCCISATSNLSNDPATIATFESWYHSATTMPVSSAEVPSSIRTNVQAAAAWAPNPARPPLYFDIPFENGQQLRAVVDRMTTNRPLSMVDQYVVNLRRMGLAFDVGDLDTNIAANLTEMSRVLGTYQVPHSFEVYAGDHNNRIPERFETKVLPFFSARLAPR